MSESSSFNTQSSSSSSGSTLLNNPQTDLLTQIAQYAWSQSQNVFNLANQAYSRLTGYTDQVIPSLINNANVASQAASGLWNRYQQTFQPIENQLISEAKSYAGPARISADMGAAEAGQQQAGNQAREQAEQQLQSFGIDPSSGRYADLDRVSRLQTAAAAAGAGQQARLSTEAIGRQLRQQAIQIGQQLPGQTANFINSGVGALSTAANAANAEANTRANLLQVPNQYLGTAMQLRPPPVGQNSRSQSSGQGQSQSRGAGNQGQNKQQSGAGGGGNGAGGGPGSGDVGRAYGLQDRINPGGTSLGGPGYPGSKIMGGLGGGGAGGDMNTYYPNDYNDYSGYDQNMYQGGMTDPFADMYGGYNTGNDYYGSDYYGGYDDPYGWGMGGSSPQDQYDYGGWQDVQDPWGNGLDNSGYDPNSTAWGDSGGADYNYDAGGYYGNDYYGDQSGYSYNQPAQDYSYDAGSYSGDNYYGDTSGYSYDSGGGDYGGDWGGDMGYAAGGAIDDGAAPQGVPFSGNMVPSAASPSAGAQPDDVTAQVTPDEFIIPRDVTLWKGQEFFQNLIKKSREARTGAPAKGKPTNRPPGPVTFRSR